ncbi:FAD/NAD(P)-binding protein [Antarctobacter sp.]|uniref:FAD/NAD(P)-binding protein n=1 Tax=Antarctobacter sp. TaxID=1872577 RepID=UPI002B26AB68|nr:FAD/NAD(P)-binding protein [Antarctobacter sp.]
MELGKSTARIAVIGLGPRGLGALESLAAKSQGGAVPLAVDVFDTYPACGAGPNFDPDESPICLLNIPMRDISIRPPAFSRCGSFADWLTNAPGPDTFPTRANLGRYLDARLADLKDLGILKLARSTHHVEALHRDSNGWMLRVDDQLRGPYAEVLLTVGQPEVTPDDQLADWQEHTSQSAGALAQAYPAKQLIAAASHWTGKTVAIRGLALSAFDVLRALTTAQGGRFDQGRYQASGQEPARILPFSLDGKPPYPKPGTEALDARFDPLPEETAIFEKAIAKAARATPGKAQAHLTAALVPVVSRIMRDCGAANERDVVSDWLDTEWSSPGEQESEGPQETLQLGISIASGASAPTIGYTVGQVWRKWQDALRSGFNSARTSPDTAKVIVGFDEGLKRYSYGPPLSSSLELAALIDAGLVDLALAADPDIQMTEAGWTLENGHLSKAASVMVDAVLPSPDLPSVTQSLVAGLANDGFLSPIADGLAAHTVEDGQLIGADGQIMPGLCLLGRLALGSVVAADSLHDCFGASGERWAEGVITRLG